MKNLGSVILLLILFISCDNNHSSRRIDVHETPKALQDETIDLKSYSRTSNLVQELYQELLANSTALESLEKEIEKQASQLNTLEMNHNKYESKSIHYYQSASELILSIHDSTLKSKMNDMIELSKINYSKNSSELNTLLTQIKSNNTSITDHHLMLKVTLTLPMIEKYQLENKPKLTDYKTLILEQERILRKMDSLSAQ